MDTVETTRTVHGITFTDDLAWMEAMKGPRWDKLIKDEQENWSKVVPPASLPRIRSQIKKATAIGKQMRFVSGPVEIAHIGTMAYQWRWKGDAKIHDAADLCTLGDTVFVSYENTTVEGAENYVIAAFNKKKAPLWKYANMAPYVGVIGDRCYSIQAKNKIIYYKCVSWKIDGTDYRV